MVEQAKSDEREVMTSHLPQSPLLRKGYLVAGKYELEYMIGQGGMGTVWAARHINLGQRAAVKFISIAHIESEDALQRFDREAKAAATIRSRNVVRVFDNGELEDGTPYMVMEHLEGESLYACVDRDGSLQVEETLRIVRHVGKALSIAHELGIIHRDIKPENIFLATSPGENEYTAKVLDFGVAKFMQARGPAHARTRTGTIVGTPLYMSPEQVRGLRTIDHRTDIYSLGALTFTMLTGTLVFDGKTFGDLLFQICTEPLPKMTDAAPWLPPEVNDWFAKSCARVPDDRYQTVNEQVEALAEAVGLSIRTTISGQEAVPSPNEISPIPQTASSPGEERTSLASSGVEVRSEVRAKPRSNVSPVAPTMVAVSDLVSEPEDTEAAKDEAESTDTKGVATPTSQKPPNMTKIVVVGIVLLILIAAGAFYLGGRMAAQGGQPASPTQTTP